MIDINDYNEEKSCAYKGEKYLVRDNGAVMRKSRPSKVIREHDNEWTFGSEHEDGYCYFFGTNNRIHRIVATAFHGEVPPKQYVVDHIDSNRQNNRPINLRWVTKLEGKLLDEFTQVLIEHLTGVSIYEFLDNIPMYRHFIGNSYLYWMANMSDEKAKHCIERLKQLEEIKIYDATVRAKAKERLSATNSRELLLQRIKENLYAHRCEQD